MFLQQSTAQRMCMVKAASMPNSSNLAAVFSPFSSGPLLSVSSPADGKIVSLRGRHDHRQEKVRRMPHTSRCYSSMVTNSFSKSFCSPGSRLPDSRIAIVRLQNRKFDSRKRRRNGNYKEDPFHVLNVPRKNTPYKDVKRAFLEIAMQNHPDTAEAATDDDKQKMRDIFMRARKAFERIANGPDGLAVLKEDLPTEEEAEANFDSWFRSETGLKTPFELDMDPETMKEVAKMTDEIGGGLDRDGGMWTLAKMVTSAVKSGKEAGSVLRLETGQIRSREIDGTLRRRRRR